jgi:uncharacterized membrane protein (DUF373 family)
MVREVSEARRPTVVTKSQLRESLPAIQSYGLAVLAVFETVVNWTVLLMMAVTVLMLTVGFAINLGRDVIAIQGGELSVDRVFELFGDLLFIFIGIELMHTVKIYLQDHIVNVEAILTVALVAVARKVIVFNLKDYHGLTVIGLALLISSLAASYWFLGRRASGTKV